MNPTPSPPPYTASMLVPPKRVEGNPESSSFHPPGAACGPGPQGRVNVQVLVDAQAGRAEPGQALPEGLDLPVLPVSPVHSSS